MSKSKRKRRRKRWERGWVKIKGKGWERGWVKVKGKGGEKDEEEDEKEEKEEEWKLGFMLSSWTEYTDWVLNMESLCSHISNKFSIFNIAYGFIILETEKKRKEKERKECSWYSIQTNNL